MWAVLMPAGSASAAVPGCDQPSWTAIWGSSPVKAEGEMNLEGHTVRTILTPLGRGDAIRIEFSNLLGDRPLTIQSAYAGLSASGARLKPDTNTRVLFDGRKRISIAAGDAVKSDPLILRVAPMRPVGVSFHVVHSGPPTIHLTAMQSTYVASAQLGDVAATKSSRPYVRRGGQRVFSRPIVTSVEARSRRPAASVVTFGDSLTDGLQGPKQGLDADERYPDFLEQRLLESGRRLAVVNAGISGNRLLDAFFPEFGPAGLERLDDDVLDVPGASDVLVNLGRNDFSFAEPGEVILGLRSLVARLHRNGLTVLLSTYSPFGRFSSGLGTDVAEIEQDRLAMNRWIRRQRLADAVVDFDRVVRDPDDPHSLLGRYWSGSGPHLSAAGYRAMAHAVDLDELEGPRCVVG